MAKGGINELTQESLGANFVAATVNIAVPGGGPTATRSAQLAIGRHRIMTDTVDIFVRQGDVTVVATANDAYIPVNTNDYFYVSDPAVDGYISAYTPAAATTVHITPQ